MYVCYDFFLSLAVVPANCASLRANSSSSLMTPSRSFCRWLVHIVCVEAGDDSGRVERG